MIALDINCVIHMLEIIEGKEIEIDVRNNVILQLKKKIKNEDMRIRNAYIRSSLATIDKKDMRTFQKDNASIDIGE
jgi:hypothetical protein